MAEGGSFGATEESAATGVRRAKRRDSRTEARRRAALTRPRGLSAPPPARAGLGAEARASVGSQGEDWGWRREHRMKGASAPQLAGRESRKKSGAAEEARDFLVSLFPGARGEGIQSTAYTSSRDGCEPRLSARTPETDMRR